MADSYTHQRLAEEAIQNIEITDRNVLLLGSQGPDIFFFYKVYKKTDAEIRKIGTHMHNNKTGEFLFNLRKNATSNIQKSYFYGFLCHYAVDLTIHPYVKYCEDTIYTMKNGHGYFEAGLDDYVANGNMKFAKISDDEAWEVSMLLKKSIFDTYQTDLDMEIFTQAISDFYLIKKMMRGNKNFFKLAEKIMKVEESYYLSHIQPAVIKLQTPKEKWYDTYKREWFSEDIDQILDRCKQKCTEFIMYAQKIDGEKIDYYQFHEVIGSLSYETGLEV
ncbi:MAG: zinc dependent phospholipase C family protein [Clostridia bacterium]